MTKSTAPESKRRNRNYEETHQILIDKAAELISVSGAGDLSVCALARTTGINRTTIYYHFENREKLLSAVRDWMAAERAKWAEIEATRGGDLARISSFIMANRDIIKEWIENHFAAGDIRERYPDWDRLVTRMAPGFIGRTDDAEIYCVLILASAVIAPRVFRNALPTHEILERIVSGLSGR